MMGAAAFAKSGAKTSHLLTSEIANGQSLLLSVQIVRRYAHHHSVILKSPSCGVACRRADLPRPAGKLYLSDPQSDRVRFDRTLLELLHSPSLCKPI